MTASASESLRADQSILELYREDTKDTEDHRGVFHVRFGTFRRRGARSVDKDVHAMTASWLYMSRVPPWRALLHGSHRVGSVNP
jgi:hypothetical protein